MSAAFEMRLRPHKIGSVCLPFDLGPYVNVHPKPLAEEGAAIACRVLTQRKEYGHLELPSGRTARLVPGDLIVGVLGSRAALRGFCGRPPATVKVGDVLHLLNMGGVIGVSEGDHAGLGSPIELEVLGVPVRNGKPLRLQDFAIEREPPLPTPMPPVLIIVGTCMHAGKSTAAAVITRSLRTRGRVVHAGKVTGVAAIQDILKFQDYGAHKTLSFLECGAPSTCYRNDVEEIARTLLGHLAQEAPDLILIEMGDGLSGEYGVDEILADPGFAKHVKGAVLAANDIIGAVAAARQLQALGIEVKAITGPATDNVAGTRRIERAGLPAANTLMEPGRLCDLATAGLLPSEEGP